MVVFGDEVYWMLTCKDPAIGRIVSCVINLAKARDKRVTPSEELRDLIPISISINDRIDEQNFSYKVKFDSNGKEIEEVLYVTYADKRLTIKWPYGNHEAYFGETAHLRISEDETLAPNLR